MGLLLSTSEPLKLLLLLLLSLEHLT